jgi:hypothetical protein
MKQIKLSTSQAEDLQNFVTDHRNLCYNFLYEDDAKDNWEPYDLYDGCETCETREQLMATFDWLKKNKLIDVYVE